VIARRLALAGACLLLGPALAAGTPQVKIEGMTYSPATLTVQRGDTVTWRNADVVPHTATAAGKFDSGNIAPGQSVARKMDHPGEFDYICTYHPGMKAKLVVK
jgi:plastocyanin